jgi:hypothetical protein
MRAVSFSSAPVNKTLNNDFVCHYVNTEGDPSAGQSQAHAPNDPPGRCVEGIGNQNVQALFLTPEGKIFHTASGYRGPKQLLKELAFAKNLFEEIQEDPRNAERIVRTEHLRKMKAEGISKESLKRAGSPGGEVAAMMQSMFPLRRGGSVPASASRQFNPQNFPDRMFAGKTKHSRLLDYRFAAEHPMMPLNDFEKNPRLLVGNAVTAFASGPASGGRIGGNARPNGGK